MCVCELCACACMYVHTCTCLVRAKYNMLYRSRPHLHHPNLVLVDSIILHLSILVSTRMSPLPSSDRKAQTVPTDSLRPCLAAVGTPYQLEFQIPTLLRTGVIVVHVKIVAPMMDDGACPPM
jgi:hypothetical protein